MEMQLGIDNLGLPKTKIQNISLHITERKVGMRIQSIALKEIGLTRKDLSKKRRGIKEQEHMGT
ncbi:MAG: hypothetical protein ACQERN_06645 [Thermodesulfobacteriota bacterium]